MALSKAVWLDCDVILDWLSNRQPWQNSITELIRRSVKGDWCLWVSPLTLANVYYLFRKQAGSVKALEAIKNLSQLASVASMDAAQVTQAIASGHSDFEDALQIACASGVPSLSAIITRDLPDYAHSPPLR